MSRDQRSEETERLLGQQGHVEIMEDERLSDKPWYSMGDGFFEDRYSLDQTTVLIVMVAGLVVGFLIGTFMIG